jgi:hypothetical protein
VEVLRYERDILATEAVVSRRIATLPGGGVPTPALLYAGDEFIVVSLIEGEPWDKVDDRLPATATTEVRRDLGAITARLHTLAPEDGRFGYPAAQSALSAPDWRTAVISMMETLLEDAEIRLAGGRGRERPRRDHRTPPGALRSTSRSAAAVSPTPSPDWGPWGRRSGGRPERSGGRKRPERSVRHEARAPGRGGHGHCPSQRAAAEREVAGAGSRPTRCGPECGPGVARAGDLESHLHSTC